MSLQQLKSDARAALGNELEQALIGKAIERARENFYSFVLLMAPVVLPEGFISGKHIEQISAKLQDVGEEESVRIITELPPGSMKSKLTSVLLPAWLFGRRPTIQFLQVCHSGELAAKWGREVRDLLETQEYQIIFPETKVSKASYAAERWHTTVGGGYLGAGSNKPIAGFRGNVINMDDLLSEQSARSDTERKTIIDNLHPGILSRLLPGGNVIVTNCLTKDTAILMADGSYKELEQVKAGEKVKGWHNDVLVDREVLGIKGQKSCEIFELKTLNQTIKGTAEHPFLTKEGWKPLSKLKPGDYIKTAHLRSDGISTMSEDLIYFIGYMMGDGWVTNWRKNKWCVCLAASEYPDMDINLLDIFEKYFNRRMKLTPFGYYRADHAVAARTLKAYGIDGGAHGKRIPSWVYAETLENRLAYIKGLIDSDGCYLNHDRASFSSVSRGLVKDFKVLGESCGYKITNICHQRFVTTPPHSKQPIEGNIYSVSLSLINKQSEFGWTFVKSITSAGIDITYDLAVEGENFIAEGMVSHNTRWHVMDPAGYFLKQAAEIPGADQWERLTYTALADEHTARKVGVPEGTSYWPEFWSTEYFEKIKSVMPTRDWAALYMQNPIVEGGNIIKRGWVQHWPDPKPPPIDYCLISVDGAFSTESTADYTAVTIWGIFNKGEEDRLGRLNFVPNMILLGGKRARMEFPEFCAYLRDLNRRRKPDTFLVEKKASGQSIIQEMRRQGLPMTAWTPDRDKISRVWATQPIFEAGRVWMNKNLRFSGEVLDELEAFPNAEHDDLTDSVSQAVLWMRRSRVDVFDPPEDKAPKRRVITSYWKLPKKAF